jgi:hypothetical protein
MIGNVTAIVVTWKLFDTRIVKSAECREWQDIIRAPITVWSDRATESRTTP